MASSGKQHGKKPSAFTTSKSRPQSDHEPVKEKRSNTARAADMKKTKAQLIDELNSLRMQLDSHGSPQKACTEASDEIVTERERFHAIFENTPLAIAMADIEGNLLKFNKAFQKLLGYDRKELQGMTFADITHPEYLEDDLSRFIEMLGNSRDHSSIEKKYIRKDGRAITTKLTVTAIRDINDRFLYDIGMVEDITEQRRAEENTLKALREKEVLLKEVHHRVKNNMTIITSMLSLQSHKMDDEKAHEVFEDLINRINAMSLVHEKLYSSDNIEHIDIHTYLKTLTDELKRSFNRPDREISTHIDTDDLKLSIDKLVPLGLLINELVTNSYKHAFNETGKGRITISIRTDDFGRITIRIADNGCGLPEKMDMSDYSKKLGIRLATELAHQLEGSLSISNNGGAEFVISPL